MGVFCLWWWVFSGAFFLLLFRGGSSMILNYRYVLVDFYCLSYYVVRATSNYKFSNLLLRDQQ